MSPFHFCLSAAKNLSSFQLLPTSLITHLLQLFLGLPLFLFPWGFQSRAAFGISPSSFLNVWPIYLHFLFLISKFISSCPVTFHTSLLEIIFGHHILKAPTLNPTILSTFRFPVKVHLQSSPLPYNTHKFPNSSTLSDIISTILRGSYPSWNSCTYNMVWPPSAPAHSLHSQLIFISGGGLFVLQAKDVPPL